MTTHIVKAAAVVLPLEGGSERYLYRGTHIGDGFTAAGIAHALEVGLIAVVEEPKEDVDEEAARAAAEAERVAAEKRVEDEKKAAAAKTAADKKAAAAAQQ